MSYLSNSLIDSVSASVRYKFEKTLRRIASSGAIRVASMTEGEIERIQEGYKRYVSAILNQTIDIAGITSEQSGVLAKYKREASISEDLLNGMISGLSNFVESLGLSPKDYDTDEDDRDVVELPDGETVLASDLAQYEDIIEAIKEIEKDLTVARDAKDTLVRRSVGLKGSEAALLKMKIEDSEVSLSGLEKELKKYEIIPSRTISREELESIREELSDLTNDSFMRQVNRRIQEVSGVDPDILKREIDGATAEIQKKVSNLNRLLTKKSKLEINIDLDSFGPDVSASDFLSGLETKRRGARDRHEKLSPAQKFELVRFIVESSRDSVSQSAIKAWAHKAEKLGNITAESVTVDDERLENPDASLTFDPVTGRPKGYKEPKTSIFTKKLKKAERDPRYVSATALADLAESMLDVLRIDEDKKLAEFISEISGAVINDVLSVRNEVKKAGKEALDVIMYEQAGEFLKEHVNQAYLDMEEMALNPKKKKEIREHRLTIDLARPYDLGRRLYQSAARQVKSTIGEDRAWDALQNQFVYLLGGAGIDRRPPYEKISVLKYNYNLEREKIVNSEMYADEYERDPEAWRSNPDRRGWSIPVRMNGAQRQRALEVLDSNFTEDMATLTKSLFDTTPQTRLAKRKKQSGSEEGNLSFESEEVVSEEDDPDQETTAGAVKSFSDFVEVGSDVDTMLMYFQVLEDPTTKKPLDPYKDNIIKFINAYAKMKFEEESAINPEIAQNENDWIENFVKQVKASITESIAPEPLKNNPFKSWDPDIKAEDALFNVMKNVKNRAMKSSMNESIVTAEDAIDKYRDYLWKKAQNEKASKEMSVTGTAARIKGRNTHPTIDTSSNNLFFIRWDQGEEYTRIEVTQRDVYPKSVFVNDLNRQFKKFDLPFECLVGEKDILILRTVKPNVGKNAIIDIGPGSTLSKACGWPGFDETYQFDDMGRKITGEDGKFIKRPGDGRVLQRFKPTRTKEYKITKKDEEEMEALKKYIESGVDFPAVKAKELTPQKLIRRAQYLLSLNAPTTTGDDERSLDEKVATPGYGLSSDAGDMNATSVYEFIPEDMLDLVVDGNIIGLVINDMMEKLKKDALGSDDAAKWGRYAAAYVTLVLDKGRLEGPSDTKISSRDFIMALGELLQSKYSKETYSSEDGTTFKIQNGEWLIVPKIVPPKSKDSKPGLNILASFLVAKEDKVKTDGTSTGKKAIELQDGVPVLNTQAISRTTSATRKELKQIAESMSRERYEYMRVKAGFQDDETLTAKEDLEAEKRFKEHFRKTVNGIKKFSKIQKILTTSSYKEYISSLSSPEGYSKFVEIFEDLTSQKNGFDQDLNQKVFYALEKDNQKWLEFSDLINEYWKLVNELNAPSDELEEKIRLRTLVVELEKQGDLSKLGDEGPEAERVRQNSIKTLKAQADEIEERLAQAREPKDARILEIEQIISKEFNTKEPKKWLKTNLEELRGNQITIKQLFIKLKENQDRQAALQAAESEFMKRYQRLTDLDRKSKVEPLGEDEKKERLLLIQENTKHPIAKTKKGLLDCANERKELEEVALRIENVPSDKIQEWMERTGEKIKQYEEFMLRFNEASNQYNLNPYTRRAKLQKKIEELRTLVVPLRGAPKEATKARIEKISEDLDRTNKEIDSNASVLSQVNAVIEKHGDDPGAAVQEITELYKEKLDVLEALKTFKDLEIISHFRRLTKAEKSEYARAERILVSEFRIRDLADAIRIPDRYTRKIKFHSDKRLNDLLHDLAVVKAFRKGKIKGTVSPAWQDSATGFMEQVYLKITESLEMVNAKEGGFTISDVYAVPAVSSDLINKLIWKYLRVSAKSVSSGNPTSITKTEALSSLKTLMAYAQKCRKSSPSTQISREIHGYITKLINVAKANYQNEPKIVESINKMITAYLTKKDYDFEESHDDRKVQNVIDSCRVLYPLSGVPREDVLDKGKQINNVDGDDRKRLAKAYVVARSILEYLGDRVINSEFLDEYENTAQELEDAELKKLIKTLKNKRSWEALADVERTIRTKVSGFLKDSNAPLTVLELNQTIVAQNMSSQEVADVFNDAIGVLASNGVEVDRVSPEDLVNDKFRSYYESFKRYMARDAKSRAGAKDLDELAFKELPEHVRAFLSTLYKDVSKLKSKTWREKINGESRRTIKVPGTNILKSEYQSDYTEEERERLHLQLDQATDTAFKALTSARIRYKLPEVDLSDIKPWPLVSLSDKVRLLNRYSTDPGPFRRTDEAYDWESHLKEYEKADVEFKKALEGPDTEDRDKKEYEDRFEKVQMEPEPSSEEKKARLQRKETNIEVVHDIMDAKARADKNSLVKPPKTEFDKQSSYYKAVCLALDEYYELAGFKTMSLPFSLDARIGSMGVNIKANKPLYQAATFERYVIERVAGVLRARAKGSANPSEGKSPQDLINSIKANGGDPQIDLTNVRQYVVDIRDSTGRFSGFGEFLDRFFAGDTSKIPSYDSNSYSIFELVDFGLDYVLADVYKTYEVAFSALPEFEGSREESIFNAINAYASSPSGQNLQDLLKEAQPSFDSIENLSVVDAWVGSVNNLLKNIPDIYRPDVVRLVTSIRVAFRQGLSSIIKKYRGKFAPKWKEDDTTGQITVQQDSDPQDKYIQYSPQTGRKRSENEHKLLETWANSYHIIKDIVEVYDLTDDPRFNGSFEESFIKFATDFAKIDKLFRHYLKNARHGPVSDLDVFEPYDYSGVESMDEEELIQRDHENEKRYEKEQKVMFELYKKATSVPYLGRHGDDVHDFAMKYFRNKDYIKSPPRSVADIQKESEEAIDKVVESQDLVAEGLNLPEQGQSGTSQQQIDTEAYLKGVQERKKQREIERRTKKTSSWMEDHGSFGKVSSAYSSVVSKIATSWASLKWW